MLMIFGFCASLEPITFFFFLITRVLLESPWALLTLIALVWEEFK